MKSIKYFLIIPLLATLLTVSCEKTDYDADGIDYQMDGQWNVTAYIDDEPITDPFVIDMNLSSSSKDSVVIKDAANDFWNFQVKAGVNVIKRTFDTKLSYCEVSDPSIGIKITNGRIISPDSIYMEIMFEDDETPYGTNYILKGSKATE